jgi:hypothetical protein
VSKLEKRSVIRLEGKANGRGEHGNGNERSKTMAMTKRALLTTGATLAITSVAHAQGAPQGSNQAEDVILDHEAYHLAPSGQSRKLRMSENGAAAVKRYGREMDGHAMFYREGGKNYVLHDQKMTDGSMLFDHMHEWQSRS